MKKAILLNLGEHPWGQLLHCHSITTSTNDLAKALAKEGASEGTVVVAAEQTAGRGRLGRSFHAPAGLGLYFSLILRPQCPPEQLLHLTCAAAVAACDSVERCAGFRPQIKWTNDLVVEGHKLGGILTELSVNSKTGLVEWAVIGIGINCGHSKEDFPPELQDMATSLLQITGQKISPAKLAACCIKSFYNLVTHNRVGSSVDYYIKLQQLPAHLFLPENIVRHSRNTKSTKLVHNALFRSE